MKGPSTPRTRAKAASSSQSRRDHDVTDENAAYKLAGTPFPGHFGIFYKSNRPTKNKLEADINAQFRAKVAGKKDWEILQSTFNRLK